MVATTKVLNLLALDVGEKRVGVARANSLAKLPQPLITLVRGVSFWSELGKILKEQDIHQVVIGLPRNLESRDTAQTTATREFAAEFQSKFDLPVVLQDEALTSRKAESELKSHGKPFTKGDIDALAATFILYDYLNSGGG